jgi:1,4-dihydroxy-2-naphthoate octaprenyltransferase
MHNSDIRLSITFYISDSFSIHSKVRAMVGNHTITVCQLACIVISAGVMVLPNTEDIERDSLSK